jgi:hypothetical protein
VFGRSRHRGRRGACAADGVDDVVVVERVTRCQQHGARGRVDAGGTVDHQPDAVAEQSAVVDGRSAGGGHELVQPDAFDEPRARVDERDVDVGTRQQMVGRDRAGVSASEDDDPRGGLVIRHALGTPPIIET